MLTVNVIDITVGIVIGVLAILAIVHLIKVYRKSPCGDCASAKECQAFSKRKLLKAYRKQCALEEKKKS